MKYKVSLSIFACILLSMSAIGQVQKIKTLAGNGFAGFSGDGFDASGASFWGPSDVALDKSGNVYVVDLNNYRIRKINTSNVITTIGGNGIGDNTGNGTIATSAAIFPWGIAVDHKYNVYFSDPGYHQIRMINAAGIVSKVAGTSIGYSGDGAAASLAKFKKPLGICVDDAGNVFVADAGNHVIRRIDTFGKITTVAGSGVKGAGGDFGPATAATLDSPIAVTVDHKGNLYINDFNNNVIRMVGTDKNINTVVGVLGAAPDYLGDNGPATVASLNKPRGICVDKDNNLYISDAVNSVIRKVDTFGVIRTAVGNGSAGFMGDLGYVNGCNLHNPYGVAVDQYGSIYIADANNQRVRKTYSTVSVNNVARNTAVTVYPNPFNGQVTVSALNLADNVYVSDMAGRQVSPVWVANASGTHSFDISNLTGGMYVLQVTDEDGARVAQVKIVKE